MTRCFKCAGAWYAFSLETEEVWRTRAEVVGFATLQAQFERGD